MKKNNYKSKFEKTVAKSFRDNGIKIDYEPFRLGYIVPTEKHSYTPDFVYKKNVIIETKGKFTRQDRKKLLLLREQYPNCTFLILFQNARVRLNKGSKTTYAEWCDKHNLLWGDYRTEGIPLERWRKYLS